MDSNSNTGDGDPGPQIIRPIPRRPFNLNFTNPTPPENDSEPVTPQISASDLRFLDPRYQKQQQNGEDTSLSRAASFMNLTSSTLFGIYAPTSPGRDRPGAFDERDSDLSFTTPWGTGAETPAQPPGVDEATYQLMKNRSAQPRRATSYLSSSSTSALPSGARPSRSTILSSLALRAVLLFTLGMGYGILVTRLPSNQNPPLHLPLPTGDDGYDWRYLTLWGVAGVALGSLLPWFDRVWEDTVGRRERNQNREVHRGGRQQLPTDSNTKGLGVGVVTQKAGASPEADWALVVRGIGAFVGIVFAIRKLPWTSTMEVSLTLALANPFLWYLIDRSKSGFILSAAVGLVGSAVLMGLRMDVVPAPAGLLSGAVGSGSGNLASGNGNGNATNGGVAGEMAWGGLASRETVEMAIWMVSVLFCSCVCFGNIGRRLALNSSAVTRGRWGGVR